MLSYWLSVGVVVKGMSGHVLLGLSGLEGCMLLILYILMSGVGGGSLSYEGSSCFMYSSVCEGVSGISVLVVSVRGVGEDKLFYLEIL